MCAETLGPEQAGWHHFDAPSIRCWQTDQRPDLHARTIAATTLGFLTAALRKNASATTVRSIAPTPVPRTKPMRKSALAISSQISDQ